MIIILYRGIDDKYMCLYIIILSIYSQFTRLRGEGGAQGYDISMGAPFCMYIRPSQWYHARITHQKDYQAHLIEVNGE